MRYRPDEPKKPVSESVDRLRRHLAGAEDGWFFAQIAEKIAARRQELELSQQELARLVGTTQSSIARLERGGRPPRIDTLMKIADALGCDLRVDLVPRSRPT